MARGLRARGHDVAFFFLKDKGRVGASLAAEGYAVTERILARPWRWPSTFAALCARDTLAILDHNNVLTLTWALRGLLPPYVALYHLPLPQVPPGRWRRPFGGAAAVVAVAAAQRAVLPAPPEKVVVIPNGVPTQPAVTAEDRATARAQLGLPQYGLVAGTVCRLTAAKSVDVLIRALASLPAAGRPFLAVAGDGPYRGTLERLAGDLLGGGYKFLGELAEVAPVYRAADLYVQPSREEATPMAVLEAMSFGLPVVATAVGDVPAILGDGAGVIVPPGDDRALAEAIAALAADEARRQAFGRRAREVVGAGYNAAEMLDRYEELFTRIVEGGGR